MSPERVVAWVQTHPLSASDIDCATAVMLKILDGKCKMHPAEKVVMAWFYDAVKDRPGHLLGTEMHALIAAARPGADEATRNLIYERRVLAETAISRPVMKAFKAMIRRDGLLDGVRESAAGEEAA